MGVIILLGFLIVCPCTVQAQLHDIIAAEYFFDTDPGQGNGTPISIVSGSPVVLDGDVSTAGLTVGVHVLNIRVQREDGYWGEATRSMVRVGIGTSFTDAEAFFDTDPGVGNGIPIEISAAGVMNELAFEVPDVSRGFHRFNLRCFSGGTWSVPTARTLRLGSALIDGAEAFFDTDPGEGNGIPVEVTVGADVTAYDSSVSVLAAGQGFHHLYLRFRGGGVWSFPKYQSMRIGPGVSGGENHITGGEFFIDSDPGTGNGCPLIAEDGIFEEREEAMRRYVAADLSLGQHVIGVRVKDAGDRWYGALLDTVQIIESHLVAATVADISGTLVQLSWNNFPSALQYRVHYDSLVTGAFTNYVTVLPPDTSLSVSPEHAKYFYHVVAIQIAPEPCDVRATLLENTNHPNRLGIEHE